MNYEEADSVKHLASGVNKVLEGLEWKCNGTGCENGIVKIIKPVKGEVTCPICKGKTHYSWTPQVGGWCVCEGEVCLIVKGKPDDSLSFNQIGLLTRVNGIMNRSPATATPILPWEEIERIIKQAGYRIDICPGYECTIIGRYSECLAKTLAKSRQEAVYRAVIALGEQIK